MEAKFTKLLDALSLSLQDLVSARKEGHLRKSMLLIKREMTGKEKSMLLKGKEKSMLLKGKEKSMLLKGEMTGKEGHLRRKEGHLRRKERERIVLNSFMKTLLSLYLC